jgi:putative restriction endonuclease
MMPSASIEEITQDELQIRSAAIGHLDQQQAAGLVGIKRSDIFYHRGSPIRFMDPQSGIWKPAGMLGALSISTVYTPPQGKKPYEDTEIGQDGFGRYKWRGLDPNHADNKALRIAMKYHLPLIWFLGYEKGKYAPVYPVYLIQEEPNDHQFLVAVGSDKRSDYLDIVYPDIDIKVEYSITETKHRLHQAPFRAAVLEAYKCKCAICRFGHANLLDAAHIVPNSEGGKASVKNGLSLCKMHHGAFDSKIIGISPNYTVIVNPSVLNEKDGPMLRHGIQEFHNQQLMVLPDKKSQRPDTEFLKLKFKQFLSAT